ncbi:MAG: DEAD/DEAH box helicase family protein, partial [Phycisphaerae bacterium]
TVTGPLPASIELVLGNDIYIAKEILPPALRNRLAALAAFQNPEFYKAQAMRLPTYAIPRVIGCAEDHPKHIALPRGCLEAAQQLLQRLKITTCIRDERYAGITLDVAFQGSLRPEQYTAAKAMLAHDTGVLSATTSFGKTVLAAWLISQRRVNTLVLVHRKQLMEQWVARLSTFLNIPLKSIGRIGGGYKKPNGLLDVAVIQSLVRKGVVDDRVANYGHIIVDECHHLSAHSFEQVTRRAKAKFLLGLSATLTRQDGHHPIILMQCGPIRHHVDAKQQATLRPFAHTVLVRPTGFRSSAPADVDFRKQFQAMYNELVADSNRNTMICQDVLHALEQGRSPILLTERHAHLTELAARLSPQVTNLFLLRGGMGKKEIGNITAALSSLAENEPRLLLATGKYIGEGFDDSRLDTLFLTLPISWHGTIAQYVGRLHRLHDGKREVRVYDYADLNDPMLAKMFDRRCRGYEAVGYNILLPGSAVPGWPPEVPLPIDPQWKKEYAASVQRLIRDGVDIPLGNLFVDIAKEFPSGAQHENLARSATEAFLFRRLESLAQTTGLFRLNIRLPIPFDAMSQMEVDLLCRQAGIVIEIDGPQHLNDRDAYRRDRRKDQLLQENGYLVLRFLAEDIGKQLSQVLDTILRAMAARQAPSFPSPVITRSD